MNVEDRTMITTHLTSVEENSSGDLDLGEAFVAADNLANDDDGAAESSFWDALDEGDRRELWAEHDRLAREDVARWRARKAADAADRCRTRPRPLARPSQIPPRRPARQARRYAAARASSGESVNGEAAEPSSLGFAFTAEDIRKALKDDVEPDYARINHAALRALPAILTRLAPGGKVSAGEYTAKNPTRADRQIGSFKVRLSTGRWADFATGDKGGDVVSLVAYLERVSQPKAARLLASMLGMEA